MTDPTSTTRNRGTATVARTFTSLSERAYAWYFAGSFAFFMGMAMMLLLVNYLAFDLTGAAWSLAVISGSAGLVLLITAPFGGVFVDRLDKRRLLVAVECGATAVGLLITVLILRDLIAFWHLALAMPVMAGLFGFIQPARHALVPSLVPEHKLANGISLEMGGSTLTQIIAPAFAGAMIAPIGTGWVFAITTGLFALAATTDTQLPRHGLVGNENPGRIREDFVGGLRYVQSHPTVALLLVGALIVPLFGFPVQAMLPVFAEEVFDRGAVGLGLLAAMIGVGGLIGALTSAQMDRQPRKGLLMVIGSGVMAPFMLAYAVAPVFILALVLLAAMAAGQMLYQATNNTATLTLLHAEVRGRVMSIQTMSWGVMPLGLVPVAIGTDLIGARAALSIAAGVLMLALFLFFSLAGPVRRLRISPGEHRSLSPVEAANLVARGELSQRDADRLLGRPAGATSQ